MLSFSKPHWVLIGLSLVVFALWLPSLSVPWWGDDYVFLLNAQASRVAQESWLAPFIQPSTTGFWRPLSMDTGWRFVEQVLGGDIFYAHLYSWFLCLLSIGAIALLTHRLATLLEWPKPLYISVLTGLLHAIHIVSYLPLHWVAAMNSPTLVIFVCLCLWLWLWLPQLEGQKRLFGILAIIICHIMALFSKEPAILIPGLVIMLMLITRQPLRWRAGEWITFVVTILIGLVWLRIYNEFTPGRHSAYGLEIGTNLTINLASFIAWLLNVPRESIRMVLTGAPFSGMIWLVACALPMLLVYVLAIKEIGKQFSWLQWGAAIGFVGLTYGPYFVLADQAYEYYAVLALILPLMFIGRWLVTSPRWHWGLLLFISSSCIALLGTRSADYPAVFSRAEWAEEQLQWLEDQTVTERPVIFDIENHHRFHAIGIHGVAWRLDIPLHQVHIRANCPEGVKRMITDRYDNRLTWRDCDK